VSEQLVVALLFGASVVTAGLAAFREDIFPKVKKLALAVCFAASAFLLQVTDFLGK
jgi:hypothetical protein